MNKKVFNLKDKIGYFVVLFGLLDDMIIFLFGEQGSDYHIKDVVTAMFSI